MAVKDSVHIPALSYHVRPSAFNTTFISAPGKSSSYQSPVFPWAQEQTDPGFSALSWAMALVERGGCCVPAEGLCPLQAP